MEDVAEREREQAQRDYNLEVAFQIVRALMRGDKQVGVRGYGPTPATTLAGNVVEAIEDEGKVFAHALGFHDALLRDGGGYDVPDEHGASYEEGHRLGAESDREKIFAAPREK